jgi:hypothetical protein
LTPALGHGNECPSRAHPDRAIHDKDRSVSTGDTFPLDPQQDRAWNATRLIFIGVITLIFSLAAIYASASMLGEHQNDFRDLDHVRY